MQVGAGHPEFAQLLSPTLQHCKEEGVFTQQQALEYLGEGGAGGRVDGAGRAGRVAGMLGLAALSVEEPCGPLGR